jgi:SpoVK/Ycf46/Vps4 family AAA+-type ATPase
MKVSAPGLPAEMETPFCDAVADAVVSASKKLRIDKRPVVVTADFRANARAPASNRKGGHEDGRSVDDFAALLRAPRANAALLRLSGDTQEKLGAALDRLKLRQQVYQDWGLSAIDPFPRLTLNFAGPPGTGKTLAAHYLAASLGQQIIEVSYADIVSKYFGEAAKNLSALYSFAATQNAVLFVDEAETLLSRRTSSKESADHAVNSMRSQLLILMEKSPILSVFASNLTESYDPAFASRLITIEFNLPDADTRRQIWAAHLPCTLPLARDVTPDALALAHADLNGRQIVRAVVEAAHRAAALKQAHVAREHFDWAVRLVSNADSPVAIADSEQAAVPCLPPSTPGEHT